MDYATLGLTMAAAAVTVAVVMGVTLALALARDLVRVVDVAWGTGFVLVAAVSAAVSATGDGSGGARLILLALTGLWGLRLATHLVWRGWGKPEDRRYAELIEQEQGSRAVILLRKIFVPQGLIMWVVSLVVQVGMNDPQLFWPSAVLGVVLWLVGVFFEAAGDWQLARFVDDPDNHGQVMDRGLWRYTRHPNYFGDACVWWGIWLVAASSWPGLAAVACPLLMTYLLVGGTGKATLEKDMHSRRPGYRQYAERTSGFVPMAPRGGRTAERDPDE